MCQNVIFNVMELCILFAVTWDASVHTDCIRQYYDDILIFVMILYDYHMHIQWFSKRV